MKRSWVLLMFVVVAMMGNVLLAGTISGKIIDEDAFSLAGANVYIEELGVGAASDQDGEFIILNVPSGNYKLNVTYIGYKSKEVEASVSASKTTILNIELKSGVVYGNEVLVVGDRLKGQAKALQQQKTNDKISNIVSADQIGRFPDANIGDALKRIPSIHVNYDQGEARFVNIRGTDARLNSVTINGDRVPSAEGEVRAVQVDLIPSDMIQTIEVSKAITADMDADAIGGAINLVTRKAPNERRISGTLGSGYNVINGEFQKIGSVVLGQRFLGDKLGAVLSASYFDNPMGSHDVEGEWDRDDNGNLMLKEWQERTYFVQRVRRSISANFDYLINDNHKLMLNTMYNHRNDWENRYRIVYKDLDEGDEAKIERQIKGGIDNDDNKNARLEDQRVTTLSLGGEDLFGNIKMDWAVGYSKASEEKPNERYIQYQVEDVEFSQDLSDTREPKINTNDPSAVAYENFELDELTEESKWTDEQDIKAKLNVEIPMIKEGQYKNFLKLGLKYKQKTKERDNEFYEYTPENDDLKYMTDTKLKDITDDDYLAGDYKAGKFTDADYLGGLKLNDASLFEKEDKPDEYAPDNYEATETVTAGFLMLKQNINDKLSVNAGLRVEMTNVDYTGNEWIEEDENGNENVVKSVNGTDDYTDILPSLHVKYDFDKNTVIRAAWTNTIARPNYYDLVPYRSIEGYDGDDNIFEEMAVGNPALEPTRSMNFDLMGEKYFSTIGLISAGVFYKNISDYIYVQEINDYTENGRVYEDFYKPMNGGDAFLYGFEVAYQQQLGFISPMLKNVGVYFNYTYTYSEADNPAIQAELEDSDEDKIGLPGTAPHALNAALTYQNKKLATGLSFNFTDAYLDADEMDLTPGLERYYDKVFYLDFNASYAINDNFRLFMEVNNLLNQPLRYYAGDPDNTYQAEYYNRRMSFGLKFDL